MLPRSRSSLLFGGHVVPKGTEETTLKKLDLYAYRRAHRWRAEETGECLFLIDVALPNPNTKDMQHLLELADQHHQRVRAALNIEQDSIKDGERRRKVNVWLYTPEVLEQGGLVNPDKPRMFYGTVNAAGLHLVTHDMAWDDPIVIDRVIHEVVHFWWAEQVGEAPSLLNEGIAAYFERILANDAVQRRGEVKRFWQEYADRARPGFLRRLCKNDVFWTEDAAGEPVYEVGGALASFLLSNHGLPSVRRIFLESHFHDSQLVAHIEDVIGESIDSLEQQITRWSRVNG